MSDKKGNIQLIADKTEWDEAVATKGSLVVLDCFAIWCGPCRAIEPKIKEFSTTYSDARFYKLDTDENRDLSEELGVHALPTFFFFKDGKKVGEVLGADITKIEAAIKHYI